MRAYITIISVFTLAIIASCSKPKTYSKIPKINGAVFVPSDTDGTTSVRSGNPLDTVYIVLDVADGDGNLSNVYLKDSRATDLIPLPFPEIPNEITDGGNGVKGQCILRIDAPSFLVLRPDHPGGDTLYYEIYVQDEDSQPSNHLTTKNIYITP
jgi:hypothetical protein